MPEVLTERNLDLRLLQCHALIARLHSDKCPVVVAAFADTSKAAAAAAAVLGAFVVHGLASERALNQQHVLLGMIAGIGAVETEGWAAAAAAAG